MGFVQSTPKQSPSAETPSPRTRFGRYTLVILIANIFVILWGGVVSASGAGDGCGDSWPLCADAAERTATPIETFIELSHRATSGIALLLVVWMLWRAFKLYPSGSRVRFAAVGSMLFMLGEAAIGALIVIFRLVADNISLARAFTQPLHLVNTYLLLAFLGLTVYWSWNTTNGDQPRPSFRQHALFRPILFAMLGLLLLSAFGTIASLASTIFPSETFAEGLAKDFSADSHYLIRLRVWHPVIATALGLYLWRLTQRIEEYVPTQHVDRVGMALIGLFIAQYALGGINALLLTPIWVQILHLLLSDLIWLALIWLTAIVLDQPSASSTPATA